MSGARLLVCVGLGLMLFGFVKPRPVALAAPPPESALGDYGENNEDTARRRYGESAPRHWRQTLTRR